MIILAIETSCDDTCASVIKVSGKKKPVFNVLSSVVSSQTALHRKWGGVYPALAKREHQINLPFVLTKTLHKAKFLIPNPKSQIPKFSINAIAVTAGPGLDPCLWTGINFAKDLAKKWNLPIIPVNHIEAHILVNFSVRGGPAWGWPAVCLVVSGGHTQLILMRDIGDYKILGETRDDAIGECLDKVARILGLGYPGGPIIYQFAQICGGKASARLPRPMINSDDYDFSFSGLKTAVLYNFKKQDLKIRKSRNYIKKMCQEVQQAAVDVLIKKTIKAAENYNAKMIILGGGVSANKELRKQLKKKIKKDLPKVGFSAPDPKYSVDNAVMTGIAGYFNQCKKTKNYDKIKAKPNLRI